MRIDRLLAITILMLSRERVTARELAEKFEVSIRTIYRDFDSLNLAGIPVISYSGNNGGYGIMENYRLDRRLLNPQDLTSILSALHGINRTLDDKSLASAIDKISSLIPRDQSRNIMQNLEQVVIDILPWGETPGRSDDIRSLHRAIASHKIVEFSYINTKGEKSIRKAEPMTLVFKSYSWYLFAYCLTRQDYRFFRFSRLKDLKILSSSFTRRDKSYKDCLGPMMDSGKPTEFVLRFSPDVEQFIMDSFEGENIEPQADGSTIVRFIMPLNEWVYGFFLSFGESVEVLSPENVRQILSEKIKKIHSIYKPDIGLS